MTDPNEIRRQTALRQKAFKLAQAAAGFVRLEAYVTAEQREKFRALGGDDWLRRMIDRAAQHKAELKRNSERKSND